jgi:tol-pal system protein YbgF
MRLTLTALLPAMLAAGCASTPDKDPVQLRLNDLEARVARMERIVANEVQVSQNVDEMQGNLRELRGQIEELQHNNEALSKQQRDLYGDLDRRLTAGGGGGAVLAAAAAGTAAGAAAGADGGAAGSNAPSPTEQAVYGQAFDALKAGSYSTAITGFKDFLHTYPNSSLADNAQYWLGEAYYVSHEYDSAAGAFRTVLKKWPDSRKASDAMLKLGARRSMRSLKSIRGPTRRSSPRSGCAACRRSPHNSRQRAAYGVSRTRSAA